MTSRGARRRKRKETTCLKSSGGCPLTVRGVPHAARPSACLLIASTPDVPFCAAARMATAVVMARCSAPERVRSIADYGRFGEEPRDSVGPSFCAALGRGGRHRWRDIGWFWPHRGRQYPEQEPAYRPVNYTGGQAE